MPLTITFAADPPDRGTLVVRGLPQAWPEVLVAVQRDDDDSYLTVHQLWTQTPSWHPCARTNGDAAETRFDAGPALTAGIRAAGTTPLRVHLRRGDFADRAPLALLRPPTLPTDAADQDVAAPINSPVPDAGSARRGTVAAAPREALRTLERPTASAVPSASADEPSLTWTKTAGAVPTTTRTLERAQDSRADSSPAPFRLKWRLALSALVIIGLGGLLWAYLTTEQEAPPPAGTETATGRTGTSTPAGVTPATPAAGTGKALYLDLKRRSLPAADLFARAEQADQAGDCEAAIRLFMDAAKSDAALAERLGRRYDPEGFQPSPCFPEPKPDSALVWYQGAAEQSIPRAQRRYGELLLGEADVGPIYQDAVDWLRKAAAAGDATAQQRLDALGEH
ncbi:hypothetical protein [uncultured Lamprocystis sp.]|jgi:hypothetical protein|uniref:hypothetical protein n=1 Tax=uncultured Lamprocystis sp. TaxID=543132 RepID=UPI0025F2EB13|nr:hypothetical protein [uncultured Lamprocystis sp.]